MLFWQILQKTTETKIGDIPRTYETKRLTSDTPPVYTASSPSAGSTLGLSKGQHETTKPRKETPCSSLLALNCTLMGATRLANEGLANSQLEFQICFWEPHFKFLEEPIQKQLMSHITPHYMTSPISHSTGRALGVFHKLLTMQGLLLVQTQRNRHFFEVFEVILSINNK